MALAEIPEVDRVPVDSFGIRLAIIRASRGWNMTQAAKACDVKPENWRLWEIKGRHPQDYEKVCRKIAEGSGFDRVWISAGGPLRSRCFSLVAQVDGQESLPGMSSDIPRPMLAAV